MSLVSAEVADLPATVHALLHAGLTVRDVAELFRAHPRAIEALIAI